MLRKYINNNKPRWTKKHIISFIIVMNIKIFIYIIECTVWFCGFMLIAFCLHCEIYNLIVDYYFLILSENMILNYIKLMKRFRMKNISNVTVKHVLLLLLHWWFYSHLIDLITTVLIKVILVNKLFLYKSIIQYLLN